MVCSGSRNDATPRRPSAQPSWRTDQRGGVKAGQHLTPGRAGGIKVTTGQPGDEPAIRRRRGQPLPAIAGKYLPQQDRQRPAVQHDVVIGQHKPVLICCGADAARAREGRLVRRYRRPRRVRRRTPAGSARRGTGPSSLRSTYRQGAIGIGRDDLHRLVELVGESGHQVWDAESPPCARHRAGGADRADRST